MSDKLLCACGDSLTIEAVCVNCHVAELAAKDASIETWKSRSDRCDQQAKMWEQRALEAGARAEKVEAEVERLESELIAAQVTSRLWHEAVKERRVLPTGRYYGPDEKVPVQRHE